MRVSISYPRFYFRLKSFHGRKDGFNFAHLIIGYLMGNPSKQTASLAFQTVVSWNSRLAICLLGERELGGMSSSLKSKTPFVVKADALFLKPKVNGLIIGKTATGGV